MPAVSWGAICYMAGNEMKKVLLMVLILIGFGVLIGVVSFFVCEKKKEIARLSDSKVEDVSFCEVWPSFSNNAKGVRVVYHIENNGYHSLAYWQPFSSESILLWK